MDFHTGVPDVVLTYRAIRVPGGIGVRLSMLSLKVLSIHFSLYPEALLHCFSLRILQRLHEPRDNCDLLGRLRGSL